MQFLRPLVPLRLERVFVVGELFRLLVNVVVAHVLLDVGDLRRIHRVLVHTEPHQTFI